MYKYVVFIQILLFAIFMLENINNLNEIEYAMDFGGILGLNEYTFTLNLYAVFALVLVLFLLSLAVTISIFDSGINEFGSSIFTKYLFYFSFYSILSVGNIYYILAIGTLGVIFELFISVIWMLNIFEEFAGSESNETL